MTTIDLSLEPGPHGSHVYYPGHLLRGTAVLSLERVKSFRGFYILVFGQARAHWTETRTSSTGSGKNRRTTTHTVHFEGKEVYLNSRTYLFGQHGGSAIDIQPGIHRYSFACQLPSEIPYSLDAAHGNIAYFVEAVLDIPWKFDKEIKTSFTVVRHDDLNIYQELKLGQALEKYKTFCCLFCESQPMLVQASIPCSGFAKGQSIPIKVQYTNKSDVDVLATHFKLYRGIYFTSQSPHTKTRSDVEVMVEKIDRGAKREQNVHIEAFLEIPSVLMNSNGRFCQTVKVEYYLQVEAVVDGCHSNPTLKFPITIGTVGFDSNYQVPQTEPYTAVPSAPFPQPDTPLIQPTAPMELAGPPNDLPPTFDEAMSMPKPDSSTLMQQPASSNVGWNVALPSAPVPEKS